MAGGPHLDFEMRETTKASPVVALAFVLHGRPTRPENALKSSCEFEWPTSPNVCAFAGVHLDREHIIRRASLGRVSAMPARAFSLLSPA